MWINDKSWLVVKNVIFFNAFIGTIIAGIIAWILTADVEPQIWVWGAITVAVFCGIYAIQWPYRNTVSKLFSSQKGDSDQIISNILQKKGLPYKHGKVFELTDMNVDVKAKYYKDYRSNFGGVVVSIGPITDENLPLVKSLQQKIDVGFQPRGLS